LNQWCLRTRVRTATIGLVIALAIVWWPAGAASAKVFASQQQALAEAFPDSSRIERKTLLIRKKDAEKITAITHAEVESKIVVIHTAYKEDELLGYAHIDVHNVRTKPEAFMVVLKPDGSVASVRILAFHEPLDYLPTDRWYRQFTGKSLKDALRVGHDVHGVVGATLSARAAADGVRRMLAYWEVLLKSPGVETQAP
jgi:Na+-translocating ferredoxin:NAD+ oxidoreductase RnfG subunit